MTNAARIIISVGVIVGVTVGEPALAQAKQPPSAPSSAAQQFDLAAQLAAGKLRVVNREVTPLKGERNGIHVSETSGIGIVWVQGTDFGEGTIEVDLRGRDVLQQSFVGIAFHGKDDGTYESVYVRPFNFRAEDPVRHGHAVQYTAQPDFDWPRLRKEFPEEFENPVDKSLVPTDWLTLRVVVKGQTIQIFVGPVTTPTLEVRKLGQQDRGMIGLWTGTTSDGDFANLRITPAK
jgi:hypothetical protein